jgi:hypothetical protein
MLENLSYIYQAMYALDLYDSIQSMLGFFLIALPAIWGFVWFITLMISIENSNAFGIQWRATKWFQFASLAVFIMAVVISTIMPSKNTVKAYIGVKAVQAVGDYLDKNTDIPERSKHTMTRLWDKVDGYIESIDFEEEVKEIKDSSKSKADSLVQDVKKVAGKERVDSLVQSVKQAAIDSMISTIKK